MRTSRGRVGVVSLFALVGLAAISLAVGQVLPAGEEGVEAARPEGDAGQGVGQAAQQEEQAGQQGVQPAHEGTTTAVGPVVPLHARALGDIVDQFTPPAAAPGHTNFCSIGLAFDGEFLYYTRCNDENIYSFRPGAPTNLIGTFDTNISEIPTGMAYDRKRNGLWIGAQNCDGTGMPINFWSFGTGTVTKMFTIPTTLNNPATGAKFLFLCVADGLAYNENDPGTIKDDEIWYSDDVNHNLGVFSPDGALLRGYDARTIHASFSNLAGLAIGGANLYMSNDGSQAIYRVDASTFKSLGSFATLSDRLEDMECDPVTYAPTEVMWVRSTPQGAPADDLFTAFEIEPGTCQVGGGGSFNTFIGDEAVVGKTAEAGGS